MEEIGILELSFDQIEELCEIAEDTARRYVLSKVPPRRILNLDVTIEAEGIESITLNVDVEVILSPLMKNFDVDNLVKEATERAFVSIEKHLRKLSCRSTK